MSGVETLVRDFARRYPHEVAVRCGRHGADPVAALLDTLPARDAAAVAAGLGGGLQQRVLAAVSVERLAGWLAAAESRVAVSLAASVGPGRRGEVLAAVPDPDRRRTLRRRFAWRADTVGAVATREFVQIPVAATLGDVHTSRAGADDRGVGRGSLPVYVVEDAGRLGGALDLERAVGRPAETPVRECIAQVPRLHADMPLAVAAGHRGWEEHIRLPVVDRQQRLLGVIDRAVVAEAPKAPAALPGGVVAGLARGYVDVLAALMDLLVGSRRQ